MKIYKVTYEKYYDDFGGGGTCTLGEWFYQKRENALAKVVDIKPEIYEKIYEKYKDDIEYLELVDEPERYSISEDESMCYIGRSVYISEIETEDDTDNIKDVVYSREYATTPDMQCPTCGKVLLTNYPRYCSDCGTKLRYRHEREV